MSWWENFDMKYRIILWLIIFVNNVSFDDDVNLSFLICDRGYYLMNCYKKKFWKKNI